MSDLAMTSGKFLTQIKLRDSDSSRKPHSRASGCLCPKFVQNQRGSGRRMAAAGLPLWSPAANGGATISTECRESVPDTQFSLYSADEFCTPLNTFSLWLLAHLVWQRGVHTSGACEKNHNTWKALSVLPSHCVTLMSPSGCHSWEMGIEMTGAC